MISLLRILKSACQDMIRNSGLSFMTIFILILMLLSINTLWSLDILTKEAIAVTKDQINMSLYLVPTVQDKAIEDLKSFIHSFHEVTSIEVIARENVLSAFKNRHQLNNEIIEALGELGSNPFGPTMMIKAQEPQDYKKIIAALQVPEYETLIEAKSFDEHEGALEQIQNITNRIEKIGFGLTMVFALISFLIIFNTIRVAIQTQRAEISIKRLVGANNWFIRAPYLVESIIFTFVSMLTTIILVYLSLRWLDPYISVVFPDGFSLTKYYQSHMLYLFGFQTLAVLLLTIISSSLAMRRQLKV